MLKLRIVGSRCGKLLALSVMITLLLKPSLVAGQVSVRPSDRAVKVRADKLLREMSADEKIGQLSQTFAFTANATLEKHVRDGQLGSVLFLMDPAQINKLQRVAVEESRLHIPLLFGLDVIHGFRTVFPVPIAMAASWDPSMVEKAQTVAADEARADGIDWTFAPMVDIARDPRWGRIVEGAGEDPYLGSAMAVAQVRGFQGDYLGAPNHIMACAKHFAGYGAAEGGRDYDAADISDDQLWNVYFPPFHSAVNAGVGTIMSAYMDLNGVPATGNRWLLHDVLRQQWNFQGFVVSDSDAVKNLTTHGFAMDGADAAARAFNAGVNMEMAVGSTDYGTYLPSALKEGRITAAQLDDAVRPILEAKIRLGLFEHPYVDESAVKQILNNPDHRTEARKAAERSAVLLRNEGGLLPLKPSAYKKIAVIGSLADSKWDVQGSWIFTNDVKENVTVLSGIRGNSGPGTDVEYAPGVQISRKFPSPFAALMGKGQEPWGEAQAQAEFAKAVQAARDSDVALMVLGESSDMTGEGASRSSLVLPGRQEQLLEAVVATGKPVVLILLNGRPLNLTWAAEHVPAILEAWYPGTEAGTAIADLLFGKSNPGGKLPFTWPRDVGQVPLFYAHTLSQSPERQGMRYWNEKSTPLFPFGFGLSYSTFHFSNLHLSETQIHKGESVDVAVDVENTSDVPGDEVVQLYIHQQYGSSSRPVRELKGFRRVSLSAHEKKTVNLVLTKDDLRYWSSATKSWIQDASKFDVWVGGDSTAILHAMFDVIQ
ncbi:MAG: beta-glucosidase BglX [Acidobacteriaceae bacterium]